MCYKIVRKTFVEKLIFFANYSFQKAILLFKNLFGERHQPKIEYAHINKHILKIS